MKKIILFFFVTLIAFSCDEDTFNLDLQENPNELNESSADPNFLLNGIVIQSITGSATLSGISESLVRLSHQFGAYTGQFSSAGVDGATAVWSSAYSVIANVRLLETIADNENLPHHKGVAQICEVSVMGDLVDAIGDVVYSEAANVDFAQPSVDDDALIYDALLLKLDEAIANLNMVQTIPISDPVYADANKWIKLANSLKLKMYVQSRLVKDYSSEINAIIANGNYIKDSSDDFQWNFSTSIAPNDSRSFLFQQNYLTGANNYQSNYLIDKLKNRFATPDPRLSYYIYRQTLDDPTGIFLPCEGSDFDFCYLGDGYWARDHGDDSGVPPDGAQRSTYGIYPAGGAYDSGLGLAFSQANTLGGAGIQPLLLSSQISFLLAEASLTLGTSGSALDHLTDGIRKSMNKVFSFAPGNHDDSDIESYIINIENIYTQASTDDERLNIIITELFLASYGSSSHVYNAYRRTGMPSDLQSPVVEIGKFPRSLFIPSVEVNANVNIDQKTVFDQVFWDTNPADFIN